MGKDGERCADCTPSTKGTTTKVPASDFASADGWCAVGYCGRSAMSDWGGLSYTQRAQLLDNELDVLDVSAPTVGSGLTPAVRTRMEQAFGTSFADVRIHHDDAATDAGANALTRGRDIHFAPDTYDAARPDGLELLAHELTHVVQQRQGTGEQYQCADLELEGDAAEAEADAVAARVAAGQPAGAIAGRVAVGTEQYDSDPARRKHPRDRCERYSVPTDPCAGLTSRKQRARLPAGRGSQPALDVLAQVLDMRIGDAPGVYLERLKIATCMLDQESAKTARETFDKRRGAAGKRFGQLSTFSRCAIFHILDARIAAGEARRREVEEEQRIEAERTEIAQATTRAVTLQLYTEVDPAWGLWTEGLATPPPDSLTTTELRGTAIVTTEVIHRQGLWSRLESSFETTTRKGTQRLFRKDDGPNPDWFDVTDQAEGSDLNPRGTPKGAISVEWNMPPIGPPKSHSNFVADMAAEMIISEIPPSLVIPYVKDSILVEHFEFAPPGVNPYQHMSDKIARRWSATGERKLNFWLNKVGAAASFGGEAAGAAFGIGRTLKQAAKHATKEATKDAQRAAVQAAKRAAEKAQKDAAEKAAKEAAEKAENEAAEKAAKEAADNKGAVAKNLDDLPAKQAMKKKRHAKWQETLDPESKQALDANPTAAKVYRDMPPRVRELLTLCASECIPLKPPPTKADIDAIEALMKRTGAKGNDKGLREYLHVNRNNLSKAVDDLTGVKNNRQLRDFLDDQVRNRAKAVGGDAVKKGDRWEFRFKPGDKPVNEYTIGRHGNNASNLGTNNFFQSHHGIQDAWAMERKVPGYARDDCPAILLRDSRRGTPHEIINTRQRGRAPDRGTSTYGKERKWLKEDMEAAGVPKKDADMLLKESDEYFEKLYNDALSTHGADGLKQWFGDWKPKAKGKQK
jgi:hypothetical protein